MFPDLWFRVLGVLWSYSRHSHNVQSHDLNKPEGCGVGWVYSANFLFPISYCSLASSLGAGPGALVGREMHGTETVSRHIGILHSPSVSNPVVSLTYKSGSITNTGYCCHSVLTTANGPREGSHLNQTIPCTQDGIFQTQRPNPMSGSAREATTGFVPCPSASGTMAWMTTGRTKCLVHLPAEILQPLKKRPVCPIL